MHGHVRELLTNYGQIDLLASVISEREALRFPQLTCYPNIEEAVWPLFQSGATGQCPVQDAQSRASDRVIAIRGGQE